MLAYKWSSNWKLRNYPFTETPVREPTDGRTSSVRLVGWLVARSRVGFSNRLELSLKPDWYQKNKGKRRRFRRHCSRPIKEKRVSTSEL